MALEAIVGYQLQGLDTRLLGFSPCLRSLSS